MHKLAYFLLFSLCSLSILSGQPSDRKVIDPEITNPAIRSILEARQMRMDQIVKLKKKEYIGENKEAELELIEMRRVPEAERFAIEELLEAENIDREKMFMLMAKASSQDITQISRIRRAYLEAIRMEAAKGEWLQADNELWYQQE